MMKNNKDNKTYFRGKKDGFRQGMLYSLSIPILALRDKYGFGAGRLETVLEETFRKFEDLQDKKFSAREALEALYDETGIKIYTEHGQVVYKVEKPEGRKIRRENNV